MKYHEELQVFKISEASVCVDWLVGSYSWTFTFWKEKRKVICEVFHLRAIMYSIELTSARNLIKKSKTSVHLRICIFQQYLFEISSFLHFCSIVDDCSNC